MWEKVISWKNIHPCPSPGMSAISAHESDIWTGFECLLDPESQRAIFSS